MQLGKEVGLSPGHIVLDGDPVGIETPQQPLPTFRPMSIVAKRSPISAIAELLLIFWATVSKTVSSNLLDHSLVCLFSL